MLFQTIISLALPFLTIASPAPTHQRTPSLDTLFRFPNLTSLENIAVRSNGNLLLTPLTSSTLYSLNPFSGAGATLVTTIPNATSLLGIAEYAPDVFAIVSGSDPHVDGIPWAIWSVDFTKGASTPSVKRIAILPDALFLNGLTHLAPGSPFVLAADSQLGVIWSINVHSGAVAVASNSPLLAPVTEFGIALGVNGIHIFGCDLYFTNIFLDGGFYAKIPINLETGIATENAVKVANIGICDDFAIDPLGNGWVTTNLENSVVKVTPSGQFSIVIGGVNDTVIEGSVGAAFGRTPRDRNILYIATNGGSAVPVPGTYQVGGAVVAANVLGF